MANEYGNYCTLNAAQTKISPWNGVTISNGNLSYTTTVGNRAAGGTIQIPATGKWYWEITNTTIGGVNYIGVAGTDYNAATGAGRVAYLSDARKIDESKTISSYGATYADGDVIGVAVDMDADTITMYKNNASQGIIYSGLAARFTQGFVSHITGGAASDVMHINYGQTAFAYTPPTNHVALATQNLPTPAVINPADHYFSAVIAHDGSDTDGTCTFNLDTYEWLAIIKNTTGAVEKWYWINSLDGVNKYLDQAGSALVTDANVMSVSGTTFTLGSTLGDKDYLVEFHKAGLASATAANTSGTEDTIATSENATSGFGMAQFASPSSGNFSIGHGFSVALSYVVTNETSRASSWLNWHTSLNGGSPGTTYRLNQNTTAAQTSTANYWGSTGMTSTVMGYGTAVSLAASENVTVFYWHGVDGYSAFGSYEGNGNADGPMISTNFSATTQIMKNIDGVAAWAEYSATVFPNNVVSQILIPNQTNILNTSNAGDIVSNGVKFRAADSSTNAAVTYIYGAWGGRSLTDGGVNQGRAR